MTTRYLSTGDIAKMIGVSQGTMSRYNLPDPDAIIGERYKGWLPETAQAWIDSHPGRGARTDLQKGTQR